MRNGHVYAFIHGFTPKGQPIPVQGQYNIADTVPGDLFYSPLWLVNYVMVPRNYVPNTIRLEEDIFRNGFHIEVTGDVSNCPVVPQGTVAPGFTTVPAWYVDFGLFPFKAANFYLFVREDNQQLVPFPDQWTILDSIPGLSNYSPIWRVNRGFLRKIINLTQ